MNLNKRLILVFFGILIIMVSLHACMVISNKEKILSSGQLVKTKITKTIEKGTSKTINVKISDVEYSAGEAFGEYDKKVAGDTIAVHYLKNMDYVVLDGEKTHLNSFVFEIILFIGGLLVVYGLFSKETNYKKYVPYTMRIDLDLSEESEA